MEMTNVMTPGVAMGGAGRAAYVLPTGWNVDGTRLSIVDLAAARVRNHVSADVPTAPSFQTITSAKPAPPPRGANR